MPLEQARAVAAAARERRESLVRDLASGDLAPSRVEDDERAGEVKVVVIAEAVPGVGKVKARRLLDALGVPATTHWADVPMAQRRAVIEALTADGARPATAP